MTSKQYAPVVLLAVACHYGMIAFSKPAALANCMLAFIITSAIVCAVMMLWPDKKQ